MSEVGIEHGFLFRFDAIEGGELGGRRTDGIHQANAHQNLGANTRGEVLNVYVAQSVPNRVCALMKRVMVAKPTLQFGIGAARQVHFPHALVIAQEGKLWRGLFNRRQSRARKREGAALTSAARSQT